MTNQRRHLRTHLSVEFKLIHPLWGEKTVATRDLSDGGVYLIIERADELPVGTVVAGQVLGLMEEAPLVLMEVVRVDACGVGLRFVDA